MSAWEKYDRFTKRLYEPSVQMIIDQAWLIVFASVIMNLTDATTWTVVCWIAIVASVFRIIDGIAVFRQGPPSNRPAKAYEEGFRAGKSKAMRHMSDEPNLSLELGVNPYEAKPAEA